MNDARKYNLEYLFLLIVARHDQPIADDGESFTEITKQPFSEHTLHLYKKVGTYLFSLKNEKIQISKFNNPIAHR